MKYSIKIVYDTGDTFHTEKDVECILEESYTDFKIVEENLVRIKEHYELREAQDTLNRGWFFGDKKEEARLEKIVNDSKKKDWYVEKYPNNAIILLLNNRKEWQISAFWCGYFERLKSAEVVVDLPKVRF